MGKQLTLEKEISNVKAIIGSSYDLASGGIPPHAHMLEQIVEGKTMDEYARRTFLSLQASNLLAIPGLTMYLREEDKETAAAYFGQDMADNIYRQNKQLGQLTIQGVNAILRRHFYPESPWNFEPLSAEEISGIIEEANRREYFTERPRSFDELRKQGFSSVTDFIFASFNAGAKLTQEGIKTLFEADKLWFTEPLYSKALKIYAQKLSLMNQLLRHAAGKVEELGFADVNVFNPATYFNAPRNTTPMAQWEEAFNKYFGRPIPGVAGLLEWSEKVLQRVEEKISS